MSYPQVKNTKTADAQYEPEDFSGNETDLSSNTSKGYNVAHLFDAIKEGKTSLALNVTQGLSDSKLESRDQNGNSPLLVAAYYGNLEVFNAIQNRNITYTAANNNGENILHLAVIGGGLDMIDNIIQRNEISLNSYDNNGNTVMHLIAMGIPRKSKNVTLELTKILLENGASANLKNNNNKTPFHILLEKPNNFTEVILEAILKIKKDGYDIQDASGHTPLQITLEINSKKLFDMLISFDANPYYTDFKGRTIIHNSVLKEYGLEYIKTVINSKNIFRGDSYRIISKEEGLNIRDMYGYTALHLAAEKGLEEVFFTIPLDIVKTDTTNQYGETTIVSAVRGGSLSIIKKLVELSKSPKFIDVQNKEGTTALHLAIELNRVDIVEFLLKSSANPEINDLNEISSIALAASYGTMEIFELFTKYDYNVTEMLGLSVANGNDEEVINFFLSKITGASELVDILANISSPSLENCTDTVSNLNQVLNFIVNDHKNVISELAEDDDDESSLSFDSELLSLNIALFFNGSLDNVKMLMNKTVGTDYDFFNSNVTWSPIDIACFRNKTDIINYFLETDIKLLSRVDLKNQTIMHKAAWGGNCHVLEFLYHNHSSKDINSKDFFGRTPLHIAAMRGYTKTVKCILELDKKSLNIRDKYEFTPLHLAEIYGHHKFFTAFQYSSITLPTQSRYTMRFPGVKNRNRNHTATIELLLRRGADPNAQDMTFGWTTLHWAAANGDLEVVKMLVTNEGKGAKVNIPSNSDQTPLYLARFWGRGSVYEYLREHNAVW